MHQQSLAAGRISVFFSVEKRRYYSTTQPLEGMHLHRRSALSDLHINVSSPLPPRPFSTPVARDHHRYRFSAFPPRCAPQPPRSSLLRPFSNLLPSAVTGMRAANKSHANNEVGVGSRRETMRRRTQWIRGRGENKMRDGCTGSPSADIQTTSRLIRGLAHSPLSSSRSLDLFLVRLVIQPPPPGRTLRWIPSPSPRKKRRGREDRTSRCFISACSYPNSVPLISHIKPSNLSFILSTSHLLLEPSGIVPQESTSTEVSQATRERIRRRGGRSEIEDPRSCVLAFSVSVSLRCFPTSIGLTYPPTQRATVARSLRYGKKDGGGLLHTASISRGGGFSGPGYARRYGSVKGETQERGAEVGKHPQRRTPVGDTDDEDRRRRERVGSVPGGDGAQPG
ncbi:hypothetical protein R3P38DRAFT_2772017 [Favolaschia claudopus]|uniref:Uncharacterized protein n=1 Tax=Favolaschia claudopus TaxID=2862362 RepID=A0AAW0C717_9AGAR